MRRRLERVVVLHQRQRHAEHRQSAAARGVVDVTQVLGELIGVQERRDRHGLLRFLVDHDGHADAAVGVAAAGEVAPLRRRARAPDPPSR